MNYSIELPVSEDFISHEGIIFLPRSSMKTQRDALELMATYFRREFRYDHLQYSANEHSSDCVGVLFVERARDLVEHIGHHPHRVIGGACFGERDDNTFFLDWVWLHPFARNRGVLKKVWGNFKCRFDDFTLTEPLSSHMKSFIEKHHRQAP